MTAKKKSSRPKFKVEMRFVRGWADAEWTINGRPWRFTTRRAAEQEIDQHIADCETAVKEGYMGFAHSRDEYRVVPA
jgi:hypothetical protein